MFSVYGPMGRLFQGSLDDLRKVEAVSALARARRVRALHNDVVRGLAADDAAPPMPPPSPAQQRVSTAYAASASSVRHALTQVAHIMSRSVLTLPDHWSVQHAWAYLMEQGIGQAPVVNAAGVLVGLLSRADLMQRDRFPDPHLTPQAWQGLLSHSVVEWMWTPVPSVAEGTDIRRVARVLLDTGLPGLPVTDDAGQVIGFVSRSDILRAVVADPPLDLWS